MNFQSLQELCGSSTLEVTYKFQREANFKQLSVGAWGTVINTGKWAHSGVSDWLLSAMGRGSRTEGRTCVEGLFQILPLVQSNLYPTLTKETLNCKEIRYLPIVTWLVCDKASMKASQSWFSFEIFLSTQVIRKRTTHFPAPEAGLGKTLPYAVRPPGSWGCTKLSAAHSGQSWNESN